ncbi:uncharacterized protein BROUX77_001867 [Berkeleyomyces rouxiae]|uniref:uncharacterized protein n=1 Tax=Berkeleyomyces rouxiae TaxID=2035830 RepID=UPI003B7C657D
MHYNFALVALAAACTVSASTARVRDATSPDLQARQVDPTSTDSIDSTPTSLSLDPLEAFANKLDMINLPSIKKEEDRKNEDEEATEEMTDDKDEEEDEDKGEVYFLQIEESSRVSASREEKRQRMRDGVSFIDITRTRSLPSSANVRSRRRKTIYPQVMEHKEEVFNIFQHLDRSLMRSELSEFTSFHTRYYDSKLGDDAAAWLGMTLMNMILEAGAEDLIQVKYFHHQDWLQPSVIVRIPGLTKDAALLSASLDSIAFDETSRFGHAAAPGADSNGSGAIALLETFRLLLKDKKIRTGHAFNSIEFHWYAAKEGGLLGSQDVMRAFTRDNTPYFAVLHMDQVGYRKPNYKGRIGLDGLYTDIELTRFVKRVTVQYCNIPWTDTYDKFAKSDSLISYLYGLPVVRLIEGQPGERSPFIRTSEDTVEGIDFEHMEQFVRTAVGFAYELAFLWF